jgi:hypothetical protein
MVAPLLAACPGVSNDLRRRGLRTQPAQRRGGSDPGRAGAAAGTSGTWLRDGSPAQRCCAASRDSGLSMIGVHETEMGLADD